MRSLRPLLAAAAIAAALGTPAVAVVPCSAIMPPRPVDQAREQVVGALPPAAQSLLQQVTQTVC